MSSNNVEDLKESPTPAGTLEEVREENRDLRYRLEAMEAMMQRLLPPSATPFSTGSTPATPVSRPGIPRVPTVEPHRPPSSVVRSLSFRPAPPAPTAPSNPITSPATAEVDQSPPPLSKPRSHHLKVHVPEKFSGTTQERVNSVIWLDEVVGWMRLTAAGESDDVLIEMFRNVLKGTAAKWFLNFRKRAERQGTQLTLQDVFDAFVRTYQGGLSQKMAEQKLNSLVYGKGECKDLTATENEFDRLAQELYPGAEDSEAAISLLASIYSNVIRHGDEELWEKAMDAQPSTLDEWKAAVQNAYIVLETKKAHHRFGKGRSDRQEVRTTYFSRSSPSTSTSTASSSYRSNNGVQVKKVEHEDDSHDKAQEDEEDEAEVQKAEVSQTSRSVSRPASERLGVHLTFKQRTRLAELNKCWICLEKGHRSFECEKKGKAGYPKKPTAEDLKA